MVVMRSKSTSGDKSNEICYIESLLAVRFCKSVVRKVKATIEIIILSGEVYFVAKDKDVRHRSRLVRLLTQLDVVRIGERVNLFSAA